MPANGDNNMLTNRFHTIKLLRWITSTNDFLVDVLWILFAGLVWLSIVLIVFLLPIWELTQRSSS